MKELSETAVPFSKRNGGYTMIRAIFFDIDGTLQDFETKDVPQSAQSALYLLHEKGMKLFIASGRPPVHLSLLCSFIQEFPFDGYVMLNGQCCMDAQKRVFYEHPIDEETLHVLVPWLKEQSFPCSVLELDKAYEIRENPEQRAYYASLGRERDIPEVLDAERAYTHATYQYCPRIPPEMDEAFLEHAPGMKSARWTDEFPDMIPKDGGKPAGMQKMLDHFDIAREDCMAFGDGGNDITMLEYAGIGVAMGNAKDHVKAHADDVTSPINEDGIAKAMKKYHLI
ncbi:MAG: Cof-type HAD-IIB family hydrolase [Bulleidia sp.]|nr:Cof-type HAD-IIB family hydrolase [Bulleidia sp.]